MSWTRRGFLLAGAAAVGGGAAALSGRAATVVWRGSALGGEAAIRLTGERDAAEAALAEAAAEIRRLERLFSLHDRESALSRLNRAGRLEAPPLDLVALVRRAALWQERTAGAFDPRVQPLWRALAEGLDPAGARARLAAPVAADIDAGPAAVRLAPGAALTLNGIAQGTLADRVAELIAGRGFEAVLVDAGEMRLAGPRPRPVALPEIGCSLSMAEGAVAVSAPGALTLPGGGAHILSLGGRRPGWAAVAVLAPDAEAADALSTAAAATSVDEAAAFVERQDAALVGRTRDGALRLLGDRARLRAAGAGA